MSRTRYPLIAALLLIGCSGQIEPTTPGADAARAFNAAAAGGLDVVSYPAADPGPPYYARVSLLLNQVFHDDAYVAIPFHRDPSCVPADFNLLSAFDFPGPGGPGAFGCPLLVEGRYTIEPDAPLGTFPILSVAQGPAQVWFAPWPAFQAAMADGVVTIGELQALEPLRGVADHFSEMLKPRVEDHHVVITSSGTLEDGRRFTFNVNHPGDVTKTIRISIR